MFDFVWNSVAILNLFLCAFIVVLGTYIYSRRKNLLAVTVVVAFGLFSVAHAITLTDLAPALDLLLVAIKATAYATIIVGLLFELAGYTGAGAAPAGKKKKRK